jgi:site-specific recombinase XerD
VQDIELLQKLLGHKNIATTQIYAQVRDERVAKMQNEIIGGLVSL